MPKAKNNFLAKLICPTGCKWKMSPNFVCPQSFLIQCESSFELKSQHLQLNCPFHTSHKIFTYIKKTVLLTLQLVHLQDEMS